MVTGGRPLNGSVKIPAAKNSVLPLFAASLLCTGEVRLQAVPRLADVEHCMALLRGVGCAARWEGSDAVLSGPPANSTLPGQTAGQMRASILFCAPLLARLGRAETSLPGGCRIGARPIDLHLAGGVMGVLSELKGRGLLDENALTVSGMTLREEISLSKNYNHEVIRPFDEPYSPTGGLMILRGNLAPDGAVVKRSAVAKEMLVHEGPARVFNSEDEAIAAIYAGQIKPGDVVVIRYEGPKGGPGMREMLSPTSAICGMGLKHFEKIGINDVFGQSGKPAALLEEYGLTGKQIADRIAKA